MKCRYLKSDSAFKGALMAASFFSSLMLSLILALVYNAVSYEIRRISIEEGGVLSLGSWLDTDPDNRLALVIAAIAICLCSLSLILLIHGVFAIFMKDKIRLVGMLSSVGAAPGQIFWALVADSLLICAAPVLAGNITGAGAAALMLHVFDQVAKSALPNRLILPFAYHPVLFLLSLGLAFLTVAISAALPALKASRLTAAEAMRGTQKTGRKKKEARLRSARLAMACSFISFGIVYSFFNLSALNSRITYYDRYENSWDVMVGIKAGKIGSISEIDQIRKISHISDAVLYQEHEARRKDLGISAPVLVMDDESFLAYAESAGVKASLEGILIVNQVRDAAENFRERRFVPYFQEERAGEEAALCLENGEKNVYFPVQSFVYELPDLRIDYWSEEYLELVHIVPASLWESRAADASKTGKTMLRILSDDPHLRAEGLSNEEKLPYVEAIEAQVGKILSEGGYEFESENRIQDQISSDAALELLRGGACALCILLALMGIGNVFTVTLGFTSQRRNLCARLLSIGMTPGQLKKMFYMEALKLLSLPVLSAAVIVPAFACFMMKTAYLDMGMGLGVIPIIPLMVFAAVAAAAVFLAYGFSAARILKYDLSEELRML